MDKPTKASRFTIVRLEERIAPGAMSGFTCGSGKGGSKKGGSGKGGSKKGGSGKGGSKKCGSKKGGSGKGGSKKGGSGKGGSHKGGKGPKHCPPVPCMPMPKC